MRKDPVQCIYNIFYIILNLCDIECRRDPIYVSDDTIGQVKCVWIDDDRGYICVSEDIFLYLYKGFIMFT